MGITVACMKQGLNGLEKDIWRFPIKETEIRKWENTCRLVFSENQVITLLGSNIKAAGTKDDIDQEEEDKITSHALFYDFEMRLTKSLR